MARRERQSALPRELMSQKTTANPSALPLEEPQPAPAVEQPAPAPVEPAPEVAVVKEVVVEPSPQVAVEPAPPVAPVEPAKVAEPVAEVAPEPTLPAAQQPQQVVDPMAAAAALFGAPVHQRSKKKNSSQMSVQVSPELFHTLNEARKEIQGMTGQTILLEGAIMWLIYNNFITPEKGQELLKANRNQ